MPWSFAGIELEEAFVGASRFRVPGVPSLMLPISRTNPF